MKLRSTVYEVNLFHRGSDQEKNITLSVFAPWRFKDTNKKDVAVKIADMEI